MKLRILFLAGVFSFISLAEVSNKPKIIGGQNSPPHLYSFQVSLQQFGDHFCGGVLISNRFILTAAHCLEGLKAEEITVLVGTKNLTRGRHHIKIKQFLVHPEYGENSFNFDVAIMELMPSRAQLNILRRIPKASLLNSFDFSQQIAWVSGWGVTDQLATPSLWLQHTSVRLIKKEVCNDLYSGQITEEMTCAGVTDQGGNIVGGRDACQGDSGGPLLVERRVNKRARRDVLIGLVSWGVGCAKKDFPGVYTNLANPQIRQWILEKSRLKLAFGILGGVGRFN